MKVDHVVILALSGCVATLDGRTKAGLPGKDTIESRYDLSVHELFDAGKDVLSFLGTLYGENTIAKTLEARIDTRTAWVAVDQVEPGILGSEFRLEPRAGDPMSSWQAKWINKLP